MRIFSGSAFRFCCRVATGSRLVHYRRRACPHCRVPLLLRFVPCHLPFVLPVRWFCVRLLYAWFLLPPLPLLPHWFCCTSLVPFDTTLPAWLLPSGLPTTALPACVPRYPPLRLLHHAGLPAALRSAAADFTTFCLYSFLRAYQFTSVLLYFPHYFLYLPPLRLPVLYCGSSFTFYCSSPVPTYHYTTPCSSFYHLLYLLLCDIPCHPCRVLTTWLHTYCLSFGSSPPGTLHTTHTHLPHTPHTSCLPAPALPRCLPLFLPYHHCDRHLVGSVPEGRAFYRHLLTMHTLYPRLPPLTPSPSGWLFTIILVTGAAFTTYLPPEQYFLLLLPPVHLPAFAF